MRTKPRIGNVAWMVAVGGILLAVAPPARAEEKRQIYMMVGENQDMAIKGLEKVFVGNQKIADVKKSGPDSVIIYATGKGRTTMRFQRKGLPDLYIQIKVNETDFKGVIEDVRKLLSGIEGPRITAVGDMVIIDGNAFTSDDYRRIQEVVAMYPMVKSLVQVNPNARKLVADQLNLEFQKAGLKEVSASVVGTKIFLEGSVESEEDRQKIDLITKAIGEQVENLVTVGIKRMILVEVDFVEIKKSGTDHIGVNWPFDIQGTVTTTLNTNRQLEPSGNPNTILSATVNGESSFGFGFMFRDGYARVLAQPKLVCASGASAKFLSGGEVPIVMITANTVSVEFKQFGIILEVKPKADRQGNIDMSVLAEVSDLDRSIGFNSDTVDIPGFVVDRSETNVTVRHGQTIILSNLFHLNEEKNVDKVPLLGHIPIVGELFKSRIFQEKKSELCVFVTPRIVNPDTPKIQKMIADIKSRYKRAKAEVGFGIFD